MLKTDLLEIIANGENSGVEFMRDDVRPEQLAQKLETYFITLIEKQILAEQGSRAISRLRDLLLSKFLSGEYKVAELDINGRINDR